MKCHWTLDALCCWVFKLLKVVKGGKLPKDLAAWSKRRNQIGRAVLPKRWCRSYTRHHPCHKMSQGRRSPYYWHLRTVPSLIAVIAQATQYRFYRLKSFSSIPSLHFDSRTLVPLVQRHLACHGTSRWLQPGIKQQLLWARKWHWNGILQHDTNLVT